MTGSAGGAVEPQLMTTRLTDEIALSALLLRHLPFLLAAVIYPLQPEHTPVGLLLNTGFGSWSAFRLWTRRRGSAWVLADVIAVLAYLVCTPFVVASSELSDPNTPNAAQIVAGQSAVSTGIGIIGAAGAATLIATGLACLLGYTLDGLAHPFSVLSIYFLAVQWALAVILRRLMIRVAHTVDDEEDRLHDAQLAAAVADELYSYDCEQRRLLHDTATATLLMVGHDAASDTDRLARQAERDLAALARSPAPDNHTDVELTDALAPICAESALPVSLLGAPVLVDHRTAHALTAATREALTNVERHANATAVTVTVESGRLAITDNGTGLTASSDGAHGRHGVRQSIIARMRDIGGDATLDSSAAGTNVTLTWPAAAPCQIPATDPSRTAQKIVRLRTSYGYGLVAISITLTITAIARMPFAHPPHLPTQLALVIGHLVCGCVAGLNIRWRIPWSGFAVAVVIAIAPIQILILPAGDVFGGVNWALADIGWTVVALMVRARPAVLYGTLGLSWLVSGTILLLHSPTGENLIRLTYLVASVAVMQALAITFLTSIRRATTAAQALADEHAELTRRQAVHLALTRRFQRRNEEIMARVTPLLRGFAARRVSPKDPAVQATCLVEASRLRRLFVLADVLDHPVLRQLHTDIESAEYRGVTVDIAVAPGLPDVAADHHLVACPRIVLSTSTSTARLVVSANEFDVIVSIVGDQPAKARRQLDALGKISDLMVLDTDDQIWVQVRARRR
ncbi:sensor histidine kinase [Nocardia sp. NPDC059246]|uniref:sensor histidine kinase n=1 Tax=unclassified Nocardia TaxID=2637762 RepID=UPI0036C06545